jgi:hypothetical protein
MGTRKILIYLFLLPAFTAQAQSHPRGMITVAEQAYILQKMKQQPYAEKLAGYEKKAATELQKKPEPLQNAQQAYDIISNIEKWAYLYALTGKQAYANQAAVWAQYILNDTLVFLNPMVKGLTRAGVTRALTTAYDLCYHAWPAPLQQQTATALIETAFSIQSTMGFEANYALESNWMGVRYATIMYALMVTDDKGKIVGKRQAGNALEWDSRERLRDHIHANMNPNGWSGESLGYHYYSWSFIGPALMAYEHNVIGRGNGIPKLAPFCKNVIAQHATVVSYIESLQGARGLKPDFSDDNLGIRPEFFLQALRLYPQEQQPYIKWMVDALGWPDNEEGLFYAAAWYPDTVVAKNPEQAGWLTAVEEAQGAFGFRNRFKDESDIIAAFTTTAKRIRAHQSGDNLSFRLLGLDNVWVVGGGRTGLKAGQPTVFAEDSISLKENYMGGSIGQLLKHGFYPEGGGFAMGKGSCMGVKEHQRSFTVSYDSAATGATAALVVHDRSANGKTWRLTTPEWNKVQILTDGFLITGPNGATLRATVMRQQRMPKVKTSLVNYNGTTTENASGIPYKGKRHPKIIAIDVAMEGEIMIVMTLQPAGSKHPSNQLMQDGSIKVGNKQFDTTVWE